MNILIVDDHAIVRDGLKRLFSAWPDAEIREAANGRNAIESYKKIRRILCCLTSTYRASADWNCCTACA